MCKTDDARQVTLTVSPRSHRRLMLALALAAAIVCLSILLIPGSPRQGSVSERLYAVDVRVLQPDQEVAKTAEPEVEPEPAQPAEQLAEEPPAVDKDIAPQESQQENRDASEPPQRIDWYAALEQAAMESADQAGRSPSMSPQFDQLRLVARDRYRKSEAPVKKPIWENVEKDQMGRTILRAGDCYRVLDDPSVANRWAQEHFTQYILFCGSGKKPPQELPFVADIVARYAYLRPEDASRSASIPH